VLQELGIGMFKYATLGVELGRVCVSCKKPSFESLLKDFVFMGTTEFGW
jgi:hypothetical protein